MRGCITFACAALLAAAPASAATIMLETEGAEHSAGFNLGIFLGEGVYAARFLLDRAAQPGTMLTFIHGVSYDFYGVADGIHYGGNDVPTFRDHAFTGTAFSAILKVQRPYRLVTHWGRRHRRCGGARLLLSRWGLWRLLFRRPRPGEAGLCVRAHQRSAGTL